jgi:cellulose synthase/poly-beta-1,6-N-acetylglucosamine synthase-like glycosyltransferase
MIWITFISALSFTAVILFLRGGIYRIEQTYATGDNDNINNNHLTYSVIIAARNEERNIAECLKTVFAQDNVSRSNFQVIVVDDRSEDATPNILLDLKNQYDNLKIITVTKTPFGISPKKYAVSKGIESASNEIIVFTDADCRVPPRWLSTIEKYFTPDTAFVQGITSYTYIKYINRLFWGLQSVDFLSHGIVAAAAIGAELPINANANNLAFRKSVFQEIGGYGSDGRVVSADDDQLLQRFWKARRQKRSSSRYQEIKFMADPSGGVETTPTETAAGIFEQRKRWGSVTVHYDVGQIILLSSVFLFYMMIAFSACASIFDAYFLPICACLIFVKLSGEMVLMLPGTRIFNKKNLRKYIPLASIIQLPLVLAAVLFGVFGKFNWKGRKLGRIID